MFRPIRTLAASVFLAGSLAACVSSSGPPTIDPRAPRDIRVTLPQEPIDLKGCFSRSFPEIPDRDLTVEDVYRIVGEAKVLDRIKSRCGERAVTWIRQVRKTYAR